MTRLYCCEEHEKDFRNTYFSATVKLETQRDCYYRQLQQAQEKLANWEPWMSALGRMLTEHRIRRFPDDVLA